LKKIVNGAFDLIESALFEGATSKRTMVKAITLLFAGGITYGFDSYRTNQKLADLDKRLAVSEITAGTLRIAVAAHESRITHQDKKIDHIHDNSQMLLNKMVRLETKVAD